MPRETRNRDDLHHHCLSVSQPCREDPFRPPTKFMTLAYFRVTEPNSLAISAILWAKGVLELFLEDR